jgi:hypothetical protein
MLTLFSSVGDPVRRIRMFLSFPDPDPDPLVRGADPDLAPDPSFSHKCLERTEIMLDKIEFSH